MQGLMIVPTVGYYLALWPSKTALTGVLYVPPLIALWAFWVAAMVVVVRRIVRRRDEYGPGIQPPLVSPAAGTG